MAAFTSWLTGVLAEGHSTLRSSPALTKAERPEVERLLTDAYDVLQREVAGPTIPFDFTVALRSAERLADACWHLAALPADAPLPERHIGEPASPSDHLSADLMLRFLVSVRRRAALRGPSDSLAAWCDTVLRAWPLSGGLAGGRGGPTTPVNFGGHPGLLTLYAERLAARPEPAWVPPLGAAYEYVERAFAEAGRVIPVIPEAVA